MPKQRITKDMVVDAAFALARKGGMEQVMVKQIADKLGCSVQPIYSYCKNMEGLRADVTARVCEFVQMYVMERLDEDDLFRSTGNAYVRLAKEEPQLFRIFILHRREGVSSLNELYESETNPEVAGFLADQMHITVQQAQALHLHLLIYTIGIGTIFSVTTPGIPAEEIFAQQEQAFDAFVRQVTESGEEKG